MENNTNINVSEPLTNAPSMSSASTLVDLGIKVLTGRKKDVRASKELEALKKADPNVANVHKKILGNCPELDAIQKFVGNARNIHYAMTLPWSDMGMRLLPTATFFKYKQQMSELEQEFYVLVNKFFDIYDDAVINAQTLLGDLYNPDNYPPVETLQSKFSWRMNFTPLPTSGDFRVDMENEQAKALAEDYQKYYNTMFDKAIGSMMEKLVSYLANISERLDYRDGEDKKVFRDTLTANVTSILEDLLVPMADKDERLRTLTRQLTDTFQGISPDALREDGVLRQNTKQSVDDAINSIKSLGW
ncbi:MAG: hypothetical protein CBC71_05875 [Rhodobacteraceae bacterium TMED111]|nr:MAG: hypothetical protein CBC71_05875 [Rhodobacteraceae bacterium TMED111]|tara:strand:- start:2796 stop:3704 length:909 start_codon:yes stop_codon:yes gene_type:complete